VVWTLLVISTLNQCVSLYSTGAEFGLGRSFDCASRIPSLSSRRWLWERPWRQWWAAVDNVLFYHLWTRCLHTDLPEYRDRRWTEELSRLFSVLQTRVQQFIPHSWDRTKLSWFIANSVHIADTDKTRQFCLVRDGAVK